MDSNSFGIKRIAVMGLIMSLGGSVAGCGASSDEIQTEQWEIDEDFEGTQVSFDVPQQIPGILTDQVGYETLSDKVLLFRGEGLPKAFSIYDNDTGEVVYTGEIVRSSHDATKDEYVSLGYFSDLEREGNYHVYSDALGESYDFEIRDDIYGDLTDFSCRALFDTMAGETGKRDVLKDSRIADALLLAYEINGKAFKDDLGIPESGNGIPDIVDKAKDEVEGLLDQEELLTQEGTDAARRLRFTAILAKVSVVYEEYDQEFAADCLEKAKDIWNAYISEKAGKSSTDEFYAAAQLYRATGAAEYHDVLLEYFERDDFKELIHSDDSIFMGAVTYLSVSGETDMEICNMLMKELLEKSEEIADKASNSAYLVSDMGMEDGFEQLLKDMRCLTITDYIIYNHEYTTIIENHVHYLMGRNPEAVNYVTTDTGRTYKDLEWEGIMDDPEKNALFIFMLSVLSAD